MKTKLSFKAWLAEGVKKTFQVRIDRDGWQDLELNFTDLRQIAGAVSDKKSDLSDLTGIVTGYIGKAPAGGSWDEMDFEVVSFKDDVLKISYGFGGVSFADKAAKYGSSVQKRGTITIMPGN